MKKIKKFVSLLLHASGILLTCKLWFLPPPYPEYLLIGKCWGQHFIDEEKSSTLSFF